MDPPADRPLLRIGELSRRLGVSDHVLRAWESRYGLLQPARSPGGFRLYAEADEARIRRSMQAYLAGGLHDMALMTFGIVLNRNGWRIGYLGPSTPIELARAAGTSHPDLVVLAATVPGVLEPLQAELAALARHAPLALAGADATPQTATATGARLMTPRPGNRGRTSHMATVKPPIERPTRMYRYLSPGSNGGEGDENTRDMNRRLDYEMRGRSDGHAVRRASGGRVLRAGRAA